MHEGRYASAAETYQALLARPLDDETEARSLLGLGQARLRDQDHAAAVDAFRRLLADHPASPHAHETSFLLGDALRGAGEPLSATEAYSSYLQAGTVITPYVDLALGDGFRAAGAPGDALAPYERAVAAAPNRWFEADARERLALAHVARGAYDAAVEQYDAILAFAVHEPYRAEIAHRAAETLLIAGDWERAYDRHTHVVETYPEEEEAYLSLVKLVQAGRPVNDLLRGRVDYHGEAYTPAVQALYRYINAYPQTHSGDAHWYAGLSYYEAGSIDLAIDEFELLIETHPDSPRWGAAWLELADILADADRTEEALETYHAFVESAPEHHLAPEALWEAGRLLERSGASERAADTYLQCHDTYPDAELAPDALYRGGLQHRQAGDLAAAAEAWETLAEAYPESPFRPAALLWLGKVGLEQGERDAAADALAQAARIAPDDYYGVRAAQIAAAHPVSPTAGTQVELAAGSQQEAEAWLAGWLGLESAEGIGELSPELAADGRLQRGMELWRLGRFQQARTELETLRTATYSDALAQYQLALAYADLGLYRSSILSAFRVVTLAPVTRTLDAPRFILELAYPRYYASLVQENVPLTGLDPLLVYSLIRQESLFESLARSTASAQGLMQVIPPTGAEIHAELGWPPDYETADLYHPYVSLRFGTYYLAKQRDRFGGRIDVALAGYNGGPFNAKRWLALAGDDRDMFLEKITFEETHLYVRRITEHLAVYRALYGDPAATGGF
jgi:soluble lytic murein transglycosylase